MGRPDAAAVGLLQALDPADVADLLAAQLEKEARLDRRAAERMVDAQERALRRRARRTAVAGALFRAVRAGLDALREAEEEE